MPGGTCRGAVLSAEDQMRQIVFAAPDYLIQKMDEGFKRLADLHQKFGFLLGRSELLYGEGQELDDRCTSFAQISSDRCR